MDRFFDRSRRQATVSAHNDPHIGKLVAEAIEKVGSEGAVTVEEAKGTETTVDIVEGLQFDRGDPSAYFVSHAEKMEAVLDNPSVRLHEQKMRRALEARARQIAENSGVDGGVVVEKMREGSGAFGFDAAKKADAAVVAADAA